jgi:hypothetical protein
LYFTAGAPICLVGYYRPNSARMQLKRQRRESIDDKDESFLVSKQKGEEAARQIGAVAYIEWTQGTHDFYAVTEKLIWYGYYYHLSN